jgi:hypothetical protein
LNFSLTLFVMACVWTLLLLAAARWGSVWLRGREAPVGIREPDAKTMG